MSVIPRRAAADLPSAAAHLREGVLGVRTQPGEERLVRDGVVHLARTGASAPLLLGDATMRARL